MTKNYITEPFSTYLNKKDYVSPSMFKGCRCPQEMIYKMKHPEPPTTAMVFGRLFHCLMESGKNIIKDEFVVITKNDLPYPNNSTTLTENKEFLEQATMNAKIKGKELIRATSDADEKLYNDSVYMSEKMVKECYLKHYDSSGNVILYEPFSELLKTGLFEQSFYIKDPETGLLIKFRPDWFTDKNNRHIILDFKTVLAAHIEKFYHDGVKLGYDQQAAFYVDFYKMAMGLDENTPVNFFFPVIEKKPPYLTNLFRCTEEFLEQGRIKYKKRLTVIAETLKTKKAKGLRINQLVDKGYEDLNYPGFDYQQNKVW